LTSSELLPSAEMMRAFPARRDARIRLPLSRTFRTAGALPHLAPEIVLLFKSRTPSVKDEADLQAALPHLDDESVQWLRNAIVTTGGEPRWVDMLLRRGGLRTKLLLPKDERL
jgi:hypothetical protein